MQYTINKHIIKVQIEGKKSFGKPIVLSELDDNLIKNTSWNEKGFSILPFLNKEKFEELFLGLRKLVINNLANIGIPVEPNFKLEDYHKVIRTDLLHTNFLNEIKLFSANAFPLSIRLIEEKISEYCKIPLTCKNPLTGHKVFHIRVVRPQSNDNNPLHRDVWIDRLRNAVNIYLPLAGSNELSSLCVVPNSHLWLESEIERTMEGALVNGRPFTVPAVTDTVKPLDIKRPSPKLNEVLIFSPYLIHGGAVNLNPDKTRFSLEMRFWRV